MSTPVSTRPLPLIPFLAADGALLLTALLVAWRTTGELTGGSLFAVVFCVGLGAILAVVPFIFNDVREREAALAERQRQLLEVVNSTTATATRWGTQWAAAATGLEDAAGLATRSLAVAERLPEIFQDKADALTHRLDEASREAATLASTHAAHNEQARAHVAELVAAQVSGTVSRDAALAAFAAQDASLATRAEQLATHTAALEQTSAGLGHFETSLREQHAALAVTLAEFPRVAEAAANVVAQSAEAASARAQAERAALDARLAGVPAELEAQLAAKLGAQLDTQVAAATAKFAAEFDTHVVETTAKLSETFAGFGRIESTLRDQHAALSATLAEFPAAAARAQATQASLDQRVEAAPAEIAARVTRQVDQATASVAAHVERATERASQEIARVTTDAETRLTATTEALNDRLAVLETALAAVAAQLERVKQWEIPVIASGARLSEVEVSERNDVRRSVTPEPVSAPHAASRAESVAVSGSGEIVASSVEAAISERNDIRRSATSESASAPQAALEIAAEVASVIVEKVVEQSAAPVEIVAKAKPEKPSVEAIMDPFYIPTNGYSALADAMDLGRP